MEEEKKGKKVSVAVVLLIIALIIIAVMGVFMFKLLNDNKVATEEIAKLKTQSNEVTTIEKTANEVTTIEKTANEVTTTETTTNEVTTTTNDLPTSKGTTNTAIEVSAKKNGELTELVINNKTIESARIGEDLENVIFLDDSHILAKYRDEIEGLPTFYVFDKNGTKLYNIDDLSSINKAHVIDVNYSENVLHIVTTELPWGEYDINDKEARDRNGIALSNIYRANEEIKYLGNGKFGAATKIYSVTVEEEIANNSN